MSEHTYPTSAMFGDYLRAAAGFVPAVATLATVPLGPVGFGVVGSVAAIFGFFGLHTIRRHRARLELSETMLCASGPFGRRLMWNEISRMKLTYYSTHRDRQAGWMELDLRSPAVRLRLDSRIGGFAALVERAAEAAAARDLVLSDTTLENLDSLGLRVPHLRSEIDVIRAREDDAIRAGEAAGDVA